MGSTKMFQLQAAVLVSILLTGLDMKTISKGKHMLIETKDLPMEKKKQIAQDKQENDTGSLHADYDIYNEGTFHGKITIEDCGSNSNLINNGTIDGKIFHIACKDKDWRGSKIVIRKNKKGEKG